MSKNAAGSDSTSGSVPPRVILKRNVETSKGTPDTPVTPETEEVTTPDLLAALIQRTMDSKGKAQDLESERKTLIDDMEKIEKNYVALEQQKNALEQQVEVLRKKAQDYVALEQQKNALQQHVEILRKKETETQEHMLASAELSNLEQGFSVRLN